jgi:hypothetical protein
MEEGNVREEGGGGRRRRREEGGGGAALNAILFFPFLLIFLRETDHGSGEKTRKTMPRPKSADGGEAEGRMKAVGSKTRRKRRRKRSWG